MTIYTEQVKCMYEASRRPFVLCCRRACPALPVRLKMASMEQPSAFTSSCKSRLTPARKWNTHIYVVACLFNSIKSARMRAHSRASRCTMVDRIAGGKQELAVPSVPHCPDAPHHLSTHQHGALLAGRTEGPSQLFSAAAPPHGHPSAVRRFGA